MRLPALASGKTITIKPGVYPVKEPLSFPSDATIFAWGATIRMAPDFPANTPLFQCNEVNGLRVFGLNMRGNNKPVPSCALVDIPSIRNSSFDYCSWGDHTRHLLAIGRSHRVSVLHYLFENWGTEPVQDKDGNYVDGGNALLFFDNDNEYFQLLDGHFRDGKWSAMQSQGRYWTVSRFMIERVCEAGIFIGADSSQFSDGTIRGVRCVIVSAHGLEVGGVGNTFSRMLIADCQNSGIYLTTPHDVSIDANIIRNCAHGGGNAGITIRSLAGHVTQGVSITGNIITSATGESEYAIALYNWGGGPLVNTTIIGNNCGSREMWTKEPLLAPPDTRGANFVVANNTPDIY